MGKLRNGKPESPPARSDGAKKEKPSPKTEKGNK